MPSSDEYKQMAEECETLAALAPDPGERQELVEMTRRWIKLAEYKARIERGDNGT